MNVPENGLDVYIDSVNMHETKCEMKNSTDSNVKNVEMPNGSLVINCSTDKLKNIPLPFYVVNVKSKPILGLKGYVKDGFWHVPLDAVRSDICTFNTPFGRHKFNNMPFGIISAPEVLQKRNPKLFGDIESVEIYFDDITVAGCDEDSYDAIMSKVLERARSLNIKFNPDKLQYSVSESSLFNGMVEKAVGIAKSIMRKTREDRRDYLVGLMEYKNNLVSGLDISPAQMRFSRTH
ncbi:uncharacterized protein K02A2.6 [Trichonephila clavipes]|nr:uncharacterized protein K02A2.6 [Trichonephila clavipes]